MSIVIEDTGGSILRMRMRGSRRVAPHEISMTTSPDHPLLIRNPIDRVGIVVVARSAIQMVSAVTGTRIATVRETLGSLVIDPTATAITIGLTETGIGRKIATATTTATGIAIETETEIGRIERKTRIAAIVTGIEIGTGSAGTAAVRLRTKTLRRPMRFLASPPPPRVVGASRDSTPRVLGLHWT